ncbi:DUF3667 domain-containing protein [Fulvivirga sp. M361]|uniref:DUF3667 domain-containing protein n=1 Tax=Fulvivirga sp. M361 TaxID=2594266 RepID=UPI00117A937E|nr:DUF3667 domain-containing protein [Fulvivirga sp. M361]TRX57558.1 DUF3667 domain-containing protein [Fulvivirga sp. M361]
MENVIHCINCNSEVSGSYCQTCGQKSGINRLTWRTLFNELQQRLFGFDNKLIRTIRDLTLRPEKVIQSTLIGIRVNYVGPVGYYFLMLTIYVLLASMLDVDLSKMMSDVNRSFNQEDLSARQEQFSQDLMHVITNNFRIFSFFMLPLYIVSNRLLYRKSDLNFVEHSVIVFYAIGHPLILNNLSVVMYWMVGWAPNLIITFIGLFFYGWVCTSFYSGNKVFGFFKGVLAWLLGFFMLLVAFIIVAFLYVAVNPQVLEGFKGS